MTNYVFNIYQKTFYWGTTIKAYLFLYENMEKNKIEHYAFKVSHVYSINSAFDITQEKLFTKIRKHFHLYFKNLLNKFILGNNHYIIVDFD